MFSNKLIIFIILINLNQFTDAKRIRNFGKPYYGPPLDHSELTFHSDKTTIDDIPHKQLNCIDDGSEFCKKYHLKSVRCSKVGETMYICYSYELPFLISFHNPKIFCKIYPSLDKDQPSVYTKSSCFLNFSLTYHWVHIIIVIILTLVFSPIILSIAFYASIMIYDKIRRKLNENKIIIV